MEATVSRLGFAQSPPNIPAAITNPAPTIIAILDNATAKDWSYEVLDHEMFEKGVLVVVKVLFKNRTVTAFGGCALPLEVGNLADALQDALLDALTNAARMAGILPVEPQADVALSPHRDSQPAAHKESPLISSKQISYLYALGRDRHIQRDQLAKICMAEYGKTPEHLTRTEASKFIETLKQEKQS